MRTTLAAILCSTLTGLYLASSPVLAQQKTVKACQDEWRANRAANQAAGITQKAYVDQCRGGTAAAKPAVAPAETKPAATAAAPGAQKTVKACQTEWRANRAANQAAGITEKAYVEQCRAGTVAAKPAPAEPKPAPTATAPSAPRSAPTATAPAPSPAPTTSARTSPTVAVAPTGANQFSTEAQAKGRCPSDAVVWVNLDSKIYHFSGYKSYGHTKEGAFMCERDATTQGFRASKTEKRPS